jgi:DMSO/TMAO reductase YedYZ molybdopterin-dependent catalytic subunit
MAVVTRGFTGRRSRQPLPPGQYLTGDFPVLSAGPTPRISLADWAFTITTETGREHRWSWEEIHALPQEHVTTDIHCVTRWSKIGTNWSGVSLDALLAQVETSAAYAVAHSYGGYTTNLPMAALRGGKAWVAFRYEDEDLAPEHGGPARLLVPALYFWKSAKWVRGLTLAAEDQPGFWETLGYNNEADPWREQRYWGD